MTLNDLHERILDAYLKLKRLLNAQVVKVRENWSRLWLQSCGENVALFESTSWPMRMQPCSAYEHRGGEQNESFRAEVCDTQ